jgi:hypothetical protein
VCHGVWVFMITSQSWGLFNKDDCRRLKIEFHAGSSEAHELPVVNVCCRKQHYREQPTETMLLHMEQFAGFCPMSVNQKTNIVISLRSIEW